MTWKQRLTVAAILLVMWGWVILANGLIIRWLV